MNSASESLAHGIKTAAGAFLFFSGDLSGSDWNHRPCKDANCAAWVVGHLIISARQMMKAMGIEGAPTLAEGFEKRFPRDESAKTATDFGDINELKTLFKDHHDLFAAGVAKLSPEKLSQKLDKPTPMFGTIGELAAFAPIHIALHTGQISTIRRSLGRAALV